MMNPDTTREHILETFKHSFLTSLVIHDAHCPLGFDHESDFPLPTRLCGKHSDTCISFHWKKNVHWDVDHRHRHRHH
jgi:hypothetical protein